MSPLPLYPRVLGEAAGTLPPVVARMHAVETRVEAAGFGTIRHGDNPLARGLARLLRLPAEGVDRPVRVTFECRGEAEILSRRYADRTLTTLQYAAGPPGSRRLAERFGPFEFRLEIAASPAGIAFALTGVRLLGLPLPPGLWPRIEAGESAEGETYRFDVLVILPGLGRLIEYRGRLAIEAG